jgi:DNA-binding transcriptional regulator YhcF (GntR family)
VEFLIEQRAFIPVIKQIQEQVKLAVWMGTIRSGDSLPSIREVERKTGVNRAQVYRAYKALAQSGVLVLKRGRGKGAVVSSAAATPDSINSKCRTLTRNIAAQVRRLGISPTAYARYLSQQMQELERRVPFIAYVDPLKAFALSQAAELSQLWQVPVIGLTIPELKSAARKGTQPRSAEERPHSDGANAARSKILGSRQNPRRSNCLSVAGSLGHEIPRDGVPILEGAVQPPMPQDREPFRQSRR